MTTIKRVSISAMALAVSFTSQVVFAAPCTVGTAANNFCHATFNLNSITASSFSPNNGVTQPAAPATQFGSTGGNKSAPTTGSDAGTKANTAKTIGSYTLSGVGDAAAPVVYNPSDPGSASLVQYNGISFSSAPGNNTTYLEWTAATSGTFTYDFSVTGGSSSAAVAYFGVGSSASTIVWSTIQTGRTPQAPGAGVYEDASQNFYKIGTPVTLTAGQVFGFKLTSGTGSTASGLQIVAFAGVPEINGGVLPLALLLLVLLLIAARRFSQGDFGTTAALPCL